MTGTARNADTTISLMEKRVGAVAWIATVNTAASETLLIEMLAWIAIAFYYRKGEEMRLIG